MKKISVIGIRGFPGIQGGVEKHCENIYTLFDQDAELNIYRRVPYITANSDRSYKNINFIDLPSTRIKGFEAIFHTFISIIHIIFNRPDIVHVHNIGPGLFAPILKLFGLRVVLTFHSPNYEHKKWGYIARKLLKISESVALNFSDEIIFVNSFQMKKYSDKIQKKSHYVPNGITKVRISENDDFIRKIGAVKGEYILAVGRITPEKGFEYLIKAVNGIREAKQLIIAGASDHDMSYFNNLKEYDFNNKVIFTGYTDGEDLSQLYSHARLFVLSSINEGFPLVMLEAMGYGLPLIVTDIPATHLVDLKEDCYVPAGDSSSLENSILSRLGSENKKEKYDLTEYNWENISKKTLSILEPRSGKS